MPVERKYERDIDLLLAEEFATNRVFSEQFKSLTKFADREAVVADYWVSKSSDNLGESDLIVIFKGSDGERFALFIEDKVDANLQPQQAVRYRQRAEKDRARGHYADFEVLLCAPNYYLHGRDDLLGFDRLISFEQIAAILREQENNPRTEYRASFLETASTRRVNKWSRIDDAATNVFWKAACRLATKDFPELEMKRPRVTKGTNWIRFRPHDFPTKPKEVYVSVKSDQGDIDLTFGNTANYLFQPAILHLLEANMEAHQTGQSAAIRIETPGFLIDEGVPAGLPKVRAAFEAASRLIALYRRARAELDEAAKSATPIPDYRG